MKQRLYKAGDDGIHLIPVYELYLLREVSHDLQPNVLPRGHQIDEALRSDPFRFDCRQRGILIPNNLYKEFHRAVGKELRPQIVSQREVCEDLQGALSNEVRGVLVRALRHVQKVGYEVFELAVQVAGAVVFLFLFPVFRDFY